MRILLLGNKLTDLMAIGRFLKETLGHEVITEDNSERGLKLYRERPFPLIISDLMMAGLDGLHILKEIKSQPSYCNTEIIIMTGYARVTNCIEVFRNGAYDFLTKPIDIKRLALLVEEIDMKQKKSEEKTNCLINKNKDTAISEKSWGKKSIIDIPGIGQTGYFSSSMRQLRDFALKLHDNKEVPVIIEGETGTGKEILARLIHYGKEEKIQNKPFISLNCSAISPNLFESELFGYEKGAYTGANPRGQAGKLELAGEGTLFLDEIGDMPLELQPKLLRVLQEKEFYRVNGNRVIKFSARVICATNINLHDAVEQGKFRSDLYFRLNTSRIYIPPLRERKKDIIPLVMQALEKLRGNNNSKFISISEAAKDVLVNLPWKGNIRELNALINRIFLQFDSPVLRDEHIAAVSEDEIKFNQSEFVVSLPENGIALEEIEKYIVNKVLKINNNNISRASKFLKISRKRLKRLMNL